MQPTVALSTACCAFAVQASIMHRKWNYMKPDAPVEACSVILGEDVDIVDATVDAV
jgi:hypothetical protein